MRRSEDAVFRSLQDGEGGVALHLVSGQYYGLNETGRLMWDLLEQERPLSDLLDEARVHFETVPATFDEDIAAFLDDLRERELIEVLESDG